MTSKKNVSWTEKNFMLDDKLNNIINLQILHFFRFDSLPQLSKDLL